MTMEVLRPGRWKRAGPMGAQRQAYSMATSARSRLSLMGDRLAVVSLQMFRESLLAGLLAEFRHLCRDRSTAALAFLQRLAFPIRCRQIRSHPVPTPLAELTLARTEPELLGVPGLRQRWRCLRRFRGRGPLKVMEQLAVKALRAVLAGLG
jgi:hypothetical protein